METARFAMASPAFLSYRCEKGRFDVGIILNGSIKVDLSIK